MAELITDKQRDEIELFIYKIFDKIDPSHTNSLSILDVEAPMSAGSELGVSWRLYPADCLPLPTPQAFG